MMYLSTNEHIKMSPTIVIAAVTLVAIAIIAIAALLIRRSGREADVMREALDRAFQVKGVSTSLDAAEAEVEQVFEEYEVPMATLSEWDTRPLDRYDRFLN